MPIKNLPDEMWLFIVDWVGVPVIGGTCRRLHHLLQNRYFVCHADLWTVSEQTTRVVNHGQWVRFLTVTFDSRWQSGACSVACSLLASCPTLEYLEMTFPEGSLSDHALLTMAAALKQQTQLQTVHLRMHGAGVSDTDVSVLLLAIDGWVRVCDVTGLSKLGR